MATKAVDATQLDSDLTSVANAIRTKGGTSASMAFPAGFVSAVQAIPTGITPTGTKNITQNGTYDVTEFASAAVNVQSGGSGGVPLPSTITAGDTPVVINDSGVSGASSSYNNLKATGLKITIPKNGNYRIKWTTSNAVGASSGSIPSCSSRLYKNGTAIGTTVTVSKGKVTVSEYDGDFNAGDVIEVWLKNGNSALLTTIYHGGVSNLMAGINWDISKLWE